MSTTALPAECLVTVTVNATCAIPGCSWQYIKYSTYDRMPSVKEAYKSHVGLEHPGHTTTSRRLQGPTVVTPTMLDLARVELVAVVRG